LVLPVLLLGYSPVHSLSTQQRKLFDVGVYWYDVEPVSDQCSALSSSNLFGADNTEKVYNFFVAKGVEPAVSAAFTGNFLRETGGSMDPSITEGGSLTTPFAVDDGVGYGIAQWTFQTRKERLRDFADLTDGGVNSLKTQLDFVWYELTGQPSIPGVVGGAASSTFNTISEHTQAGIEPVIEATLEISAFYEISQEGDVWSKLPASERWSNENIQRTNGQRVNYATGVLEQYKSNTGSIVAENCGLQYGNLSSYVTTYAWPDRRSSGQVELKPEYAASVSAAQSRNEFVGGDLYKGVDCGGFVTRVMRDSGYDPLYNSGEGNTLVQREYLRANWQQIHPTSSSDLKLGDVAIMHDPSIGGHTFIYVGDLSGFDGSSASSSLDERAPSAYNESLFSVFGIPYEWFRKGA